MSDSVRPHRWQPTRIPHPWDSPGKNTGVGCHFLLQCMKVKNESEVTQSCPTLRYPPWTAANQAPPSMGFSRHEYWSGLPLPSPYYFTHYYVARLQQYVNRELPDVQAGFKKGRGTRDQIANIRWIIKKQESSRKTPISALLTMPKPLTVWLTTNCGKF